MSLDGIIDEDSIGSLDGAIAEADAIIDDAAMVAAAELDSLLVDPLHAARVRGRAIRAAARPVRRAREDRVMVFSCA